MDAEIVAREFGSAADALVVACQRLEQLGVADPPIEQLYQALNAVTAEVQRLHPPPTERQFDGVRGSGCRVALTDD